MTENWLILETSGRIGKLGLARGGAVVQSRMLDDSRRHARDLAATVDAVLRAESLAPQDLTGVIAGIGPGSYTGLRVGLMSAKSLAFAIDCEFRAVETFAAIALQAPAGMNRQWVIANALQDHIYAQQFERNGEHWRALGELAIEPFQDWVGRIEAGEWIGGPGVDDFVDRLPPASALAPHADREARVESVFAIGRRMKPLGRTEIFALEPLYLRGSSAEEKARNKE